MRPRHRAPQTFSLWMVDVLCCALGCIILLWLNRHYDAIESEGRGSEMARKLADMTRLLASERKASAADTAKKQKLTDEQKEKIRQLMEQLASLTQNKDLLDGKLRELAALKASLEKDLESAKGDRNAKQVKIDDLVEQLAKLSKSKEGVDKLLSARLKEVEELEKKLAALGTTKSTLEEELQASKSQGTTRQKRIDELLKQADELTKKLTAAQALVEKLEKTVATLPKLESELKEYRERLTDETGKNKVLRNDLGKRLEELAKAAKDYETLMLAKKELEKKLSGVDKALIEALADKARLAQNDKKREELYEQLEIKGRDLTRALELLEKFKGDASRLQTALEQRFAGIALTGRKVVFLVDTSGSMELIDERTPAPEKWKGVRDTLVQIMKSLPKLEQFQVITFGEEIAHPLGKPGEWIDFDAKTSPDKVAEALAKIRPAGGTNLHKPFEAAMKMRQAGLDTVYLFSDGLPSDGEGLTAEQERTIKDENVRSTLLSRHLRKKLKDENKDQPGLPRVRINSVGFFYESPDVGAFLWALSREHDGSFVGMSKP